MQHADFRLSPLLQQNALPFEVEISVGNSYLTNCGLAVTKPEHDQNCKLRDHPCSSRVALGELLMYIYKQN